MNSNMIDAQESLNKKRVEKALEIYNREIAENPSNALAFHGIAVCMFNLKNIANAVTMCNKALAINPNLAVSHALLAELYNVLQDVEKSREEAKIAYQIDSNSAEVLAVYGSLLFRDNDLDDAIAVLEKAVQLNPNFYAAHHNLSHAYLRKKDLKGHYIHNKEIFRLRPSFATGLRFIFAYMNAIRPILNFVSLLVTIIALVTKFWLLLILPYSYVAVMVVGSILLRLTRNQ